MSLTENTLINNSFKVLGMITSTQECILYECVAIETGETVIATEYFPSKIAYRNEEQFVILPSNNITIFETNLDSFSENATKIKNNDADGIFGIIGIYHEKGTCYIVTRQDGELLPFNDYFANNKHTVKNILFEVIRVGSDFHNKGATLKLTVDNTFVDKKTRKLKFAYMYQNNLSEQGSVKSIASLFVSSLKKVIRPKADDNTDEFLRYLSDVAENRIQIASFSSFEQGVEKISYPKKIRLTESGIERRYTAVSVAVGLLVVAISTVIVTCFIYFVANTLIGDEHIDMDTSEPPIVNIYIQ